MKLGFASAILPDLTLDEVFQFASSEGFSCVELMCWPVGRADRKYAGVTHIDVTTLTRAKADRIREMSAYHDVSISALGYYPNFLDPDPAKAKQAVAHFKKVMRAASMLEVGVVTTFAGRDWTKTVEANWPRFLKTWKPLVAMAEDLGVRIGLENCPMLFTGDEWPGGKNLAYCPEIWRRIFSELHSRHLGLNYDPSHLVWMRMDWLKPIREFRSRLFHIHAKDVRLDQDRLDDVGILAAPLEYHQPRLPGYGEIDWARFMGTLQEVGYHGPVAIEVEDETFGKDLAGRQRALRVAHRVLASFFED